MIRILPATAAALLATSASADEPSIIVDDIPTARVSYAGLDLKTTSGRSRMIHRISLAAEKLCEGSSPEVSIIQPERWDCYVTAVASGTRQLDAIAGL